MPARQPLRVVETPQRGNERRKPELTSKQTAFVAALLTARTLADAAQAAGVTERRARDWRKLPQVQAALREQRGAVLNDERDRMIGWSDGQGGAYLLPDVAKEKIEKVAPGTLNGLSAKALYAQLESLGYIASRNRDENLKSIREGGTVTRTLHLNAKAMMGEGDEGGE